MQKTMTIQEFNAALTSESHDELTKALKKITKMAQPEKVRESYQSASKAERVVW